MGTWGAGNFDNDSACDYLDSIKFQLIRVIEDCFKREDDTDLLDECGDELMASIEILTLLTEHYYGHNPHVEVSEARRWRDTYLRIYDNEMDDSLATLEYQVERRKVIEDTFAKLEQQARRIENL
jgi:hypothetical protein